MRSCSFSDALSRRTTSYLSAIEVEKGCDYDEIFHSSSVGTELEASCNWITRPYAKLTQSRINLVDGMFEATALLHRLCQNTSFNSFNAFASRDA